MSSSSTDDAHVVPSHAAAYPRRTLRHRLSGRPAEEPPPDRASSLLVAGAVAGGTSKLITAPIDRIKIMYTVNVEKRFTLRAGFRTVAKIVRTAGVTDLWRGNGAAVVRDVPYAAIIFSSYALFEEAICGTLGRAPDVWTRCGSGCLAGVVATVLTYPLDVLRARFGAEWSAQRTYSSYRHGISEIVRKEGYGALFAGLRPTVLGVMPYSALSFAAFETLKALLHERAAREAEDEFRRRTPYSVPPVGPSGAALATREVSEMPRHALHRGVQEDAALVRRCTPWRSPYAGRDLPVAQKLVAGGVAGAFAQTATYPLHVVRRRMQVRPGAYGSIRGALSTIYTVEGVAGGLYKGLSLTLLKGPIQSALGFTVNDQAKKKLRELFPVER